MWHDPDFDNACAAFFLALDEAREVGDKPGYQEFESFYSRGMDFIEGNVSEIVHALLAAGWIFPD